MLVDLFVRVKYVVIVCISCAKYKQFACRTRVAYTKNMVEEEAGYYRELGQRIQRARIAKGLTQEGLASAVGLTRTSVVNIEKGRQKVLAHTLVRLARSLHVGIENLARDAGDDGKIEELLRDLSEPTKQFVHPPHRKRNSHAGTTKINQRSGG